MIDPKCGVCDGSGLVAPTPFAGERESWPAWLLGAHRSRWKAKCGPEGCPTALGIIRPLVCPACNASGSVEGNPWNVREVLSLLSERGA